jgi:hypothetical protein
VVGQFVVAVAFDAAVLLVPHNGGVAVYNEFAKASRAVKVHNILGYCSVSDFFIDGEDIALGITDVPLGGGRLTYARLS